MTQSRIPLVTDPPPEAREVLERTPLRDGAPLNIFGALAHHPRLLRRFSAMGGELLQSGLLPPRDREIVVLRVGWRRGSVYEFGQHTLIGAAAGLAGFYIMVSGFLRSTRVPLDDGVPGWPKGTKPA